MLGTQWLMHRHKAWKRSPLRSTLSRANTIYGLVLLFMGIKRPRFATVQCGEPKGLEGGWGAPQEVVRLG